MVRVAGGNHRTLRKIDHALHAHRGGVATVGGATLA